MSDRYLDNLLPDFGEYSLESLLENYRQRAADPTAGQESPAQPADAAAAIAQRSRQIVLEALGETLSQQRRQQTWQQAQPPRQSQQPARQQVPTLEFDMSDLPVPPGDEPARQQQSAPAPQPAQPAKPRHKAHISPDGIITLELELPSQEEAPVPEDDMFPEEDALPPEDEYELPREESEEVPEDEEEEPRRGLFRRRRRSAPSSQEEPAGFKERFFGPVIRFAATKIARRQMQKAEAANWPDPVDIRETEELPPKRAAKFYGQQLRPLRFRCRVCLFLCVTLAWICFDLPMFGALGYSLPAQAGVSLVLLLSVMIAALDIVATGLRQLLDLRPGGESLAALAAILSCADAVLVIAGRGTYLPFCAVGAFSLGAALWGERLNCLARARTMRMAAMSKNPSAMTAEETDKGGRYVCRSYRSVEGMVRRSEQADFCQNVYATASPILLILSVLLAVFTSLNGQGAYFLHTLSALLSVSASFTAFLSFPLPYSMTARKIQGSGAAIAGYAGCADIGRSRRVVISDNDLFPPGTMKLSGINILEGMEVDRVISCTSGLLSASGSGVAAVFTDLVARRGFAPVKLEEFRCHEGGGLSARVDDASVLVGSAGFMNLMGIRLPQNMTVRNAVCTAINGELVGVFTLEYIPVSSVQDALVTLLQGRTQPIFAIRDFNITPLMIRQLFQMPTDSFNFPSFRDRYRLAETSDGTDTPVAAVLSRGGMGPMVDAAEAGRRLYSTCRIGTVLSLLGSAVGLVTMFLLCRAGAYDTANAGNVLSYMLMWALPVAMLAYGQTR